MNTKEGMTKWILTNEWLDQCQSMNDYMNTKEWMTRSIPKNEWLNEY